MSKTEMKNVAVVLAGGIGARMKLSMPKQLLKIAGKSVLDHTLSAFQTNEHIDEVIVLMTPGYLDQIKVVTDKYTKISTVLEGGSTRNDTSQIAIEHLFEKYGECNVIFHDAVRPFLSDRIIEDCILALDKYRAIDVAIPSADTIIEVKDDLITNIPDRSKLRRGQTPQCFRLSTIQEAYNIAKKDKDFKATDDCGVVLKYLPEEPIYVVEGSDNNMKITQPVDAFIADKLFQISSKDTVSRTEDEKEKMLKGKTFVVFGASQGIGKDVSDMAKKYGADIHCFSRSLNGVDITSEPSISSTLKEVYDKSGKIDYIINTAAELTIAPLEDMDIDAIERSVRVNYTSVAIIAKHAYKYLKESNGHLILFTSSSYTRGRSNYSLYSSSKAAVVNLTQALAEEWFDDNIQINCINPERTATPMRTKAFGKEDASTLLSSEKVAESTIDTLLSSLTGQVIDIRKS